MIFRRQISGTEEPVRSFGVFNINLFKSTGTFYTPCLFFKLGQYRESKTVIGCIYLQDSFLETNFQERAASIIFNAD